MTRANQLRTHIPLGIKLAVRNQILNQAMTFREALALSHGPMAIARQIFLDAANGIRRSYHTSYEPAPEMT